jgi:hypothetical protein
LAPSRPAASLLWRCARSTLTWARSHGRRTGSLIRAALTAPEGVAVYRSDLALCPQRALLGRVWGARNLGVGGGPRVERTTLAREIAVAIGACRAAPKLSPAGAGGQARLEALDGEPTGGRRAPPVHRDPAAALPQAQPEDANRGSARARRLGQVGQGASRLKPQSLATTPIKTKGTIVPAVRERDSADLDACNVNDRYCQQRSVMLDERMVTGRSS